MIGLGLCNGTRLTSFNRTYLILCYNDFFILNDIWAKCFWICYDMTFVCVRCVLLRFDNFFGPGCTFPSFALGLLFITGQLAKNLCGIQICVYFVSYCNYRYILQTSEHRNIQSLFGNDYNSCNAESYDYVKLMLQHPPVFMWFFGCLISRWVSNRSFWYSKTNSQIHCGQVSPYGDAYLGQYIISKWLAAWWHQAITWELSSFRSRSKMKSRD